MMTAMTVPWASVVSEPAIVTQGRVAVIMYTNYMAAFSSHDSIVLTTNTLNSTLHRDGSTGTDAGRLHSHRL